MTEILLVRHGRTNWNLIGRLQGHQDVPLDDVGAAQAATAALTLALEQWDAVYSSPLGRAAGTAALIAAAAGLPPPQLDRGLIERHYGDASGLYDHEIDARWPGSEPVPHSESRTEVYRRALPVLRHVVGAHPDGRVVVVTHGGLIRSVVMGLEGPGAADRGGIVNLGGVLLSTVDGSQWDVVYYNRALASAT